MIRRTSILALLALFGLMGRPRAQAAKYEHFGTGCQLPPVRFHVSGVPRLGKSVVISSDAYTGKNKWVYLVTGFSDSRWAGLALPFSRFPIIKGVTWCGPLLVSMHVIQPALGNVRFPIPNDKRLLGLRFYQQIEHITFLPNVGFRVAYSRGGRGTIGL